MRGRERVLALLEGRPVDRLPAMPITMMFAADHLGVKYFDYATDCRAQVEAQVRVAEGYDLDYVSVISDPACEAADCGAAVKFYPDQPPALDESRARLADKAALAKLAIPDLHGGGRMHNRLKAVGLLQERVGGDKLIEGWIEGPVAESADLVGMGDAAASLVGSRMYQELVWPSEKKIVDGIHALGACVRLHICGDTRHLLEGMGRLGCNIVDLDFPAPISEGREKMGPEQVLLGNIDPVRVLRNGTPESVYAAVAECHRQAGERYVAGAGCEVPRDTPPANLRALVQYAREHAPA